MDIGRAFAYIFEDKAWVEKAVITAMLALAIVFFPFGFIALAVLLGYLLEIVANVRDQHPQPLPRWTDYTGKMTNGSYVLAALFVYHIPVLLMSCCISSFANTSLGTLTICCVTPLLVVYTMLSWTLLAVGVVNFARTGDTAEFYRLGGLRAAARGHMSALLAWLGASIIINAAMLLIPCVGWAALLALNVPVQGHLLGQLARKLSARTAHSRV